MFKDTYNKYGIHIGYYGKNAWVYCKDFDWTEEAYFQPKKGSYNYIERFKFKR